MRGEGASELELDFVNGAKSSLLILAMEGPVRHHVSVTRRRARRRTSDYSIRGDPHHRLDWATNGQRAAVACLSCSFRWLSNISGYPVDHKVGLHRAFMP